jgi:leucyl aminopeptidase
MRWGDESNPHVTLVGKGVIFDTGGHDIKPYDQMQTMKFDMAGAAHALGVAQMVMDANLPVRLRVLLPVVENMVGPKAYKQGDVYKTRLGPTMEIVNTDAEGRLLLFDALAEASHPGKGGGRRPDLMMAYGTLTWYGYTNFPGWASVISDKLAVRQEFQKAAAHCQEYVAPRPVPNDMISIRDEIFRQPGSPADMVHASVNHPDYDDLIVGQLLGIATERQKGEKGKQPDLVYVDLQPWRYPNSIRQQMPFGLPDGGFAQTVRSSYSMIEQRYG